MFQILCLFLMASAVSALKSSFSNERQGFQDVSYKLVNDLTNKGTDGDLAGTLIGIILDQGKTIKDMEKKMNMITETVDKQGGHILVMQERMTDMENIIQGQEQEIENLKHDKDVLTDTIMDQRAEMDSMGKDMMKIIEVVGKVE